MVDQQTQFDTTNDNDLDTFPPVGVGVSSLAQTANNPSAVTVFPSPSSSPDSSAQTSTPDTSTYDIRQVSLDTAPVNSEVAVSQEGTRAQIAWTFTLFFLFLITLSVLGPFALLFLGAPGSQNPVEMSKELLTLVSSVLAGPFGFIVGFYFKQNISNNG